MTRWHSNIAKNTTDKPLQFIVSQVLLRNPLAVTSSLLTDNAVIARSPHVLRQPETPHRPGTDATSFRLQHPCQVLHNRCRKHSFLQRAWQHRQEHIRYPSSIHCKPGIDLERAGGHIILADRQRSDCKISTPAAPTGTTSPACDECYVILVGSGPCQVLHKRYLNHVFPQGARPHCQEHN